MWTRIKFCWNVLDHCPLLSDILEIRDRVKVIQEFDHTYFYDSDGISRLLCIPLMKIEEMDDIETDEEESIVESSPY